MVILRCGRLGVHDASGEIDPELLAVAQGRETDPLEYLGLVLVEVEDRGGGRAVHEMQGAHGATPFKVEAAHAMTGELGHVLIAAAERKANEFEKLFAATLQITAQAEQPLAMLAEGVDPDPDGPSVRPNEAVAFVEKFARQQVLRRVSLK